MLSAQFVQSRTTSSSQQNLDFQTLFLSLSGLNLSEDSTTTPNTETDTDTDIIATTAFPPGNNVVFGHSSFFKQHPCPPDLPTPAAIRDEAARQGLSPPGTTPSSAITVAIPSLNLLVKYGPFVFPSEAKTLLLLRRLLQSHVPVPEVYGWRRDVPSTFIYTSLPSGLTLASAWPLLSDEQKSAVCTQLKAMVAAWRRIKQPSSMAGWVGGVDCGPPRDEILAKTLLAHGACSAFSTVAAFHEWFVTAAMNPPVAAGGVGGYAGRVASSYHFQPGSFFRDDTPVVFTHGGFGPANIVVSTGPSPSVVAVLGWEQAGWYPAYWERCKARWAAGGMAREWETTYLPWILGDGEGDGGLCHYWDYFVGLIEKAEKRG